MAEYGPNPGPLPARDFCNSWGEGNPVLGKGALGNPDKKHMYYTGNDREKQVTTVQTMLQELGYDVGSSGPDGKFGNNTEKAVIAFQQDRRDWNGEALKVDGLIGPETADALNRMMVGRWYDEHTTTTELTGDFKLVTVTAEKLKGSCTIGWGDGQGKEKIKIIVMGDAGSLIQGTVVLTIQLVDITIIPFQPLGVTPYRLEIDDPSFTPLEAKTDDQGTLSVNIPKSAKTGRLILEELTYALEINALPTPDTPEGVVLRFKNLGYYVHSASEPPETVNIDPSQCPVEEDQLTPIHQFQFDHNLEPTGEINEETVKKLVEIYGC